MKNGSHYTLSISDLLMGILFIFILILMKFITDYHNKKDKLLLPLVKRVKLLKKLEKEIKKQDIKVKVDTKNGILELEDILCFPKSEYELNKEQQEGLKKICGIFSDIICYADLEKTSKKYVIWRTDWKDKIPLSCDRDKELKSRPDCTKQTNGLIDTILIEGHADSTPIGGYFREQGIKTNLDLAMKRSQQVFRFLTQYKEGTTDKPARGNHFYYLLNKREQSLFGVTSYGNLRSSVKANDREPSSSVKERCINIRFIMSQPDELEKSLKQEDANE